MLNSLISEELIDKSNIILFKWSIKENWPIEYVSKNVSLLGYEPSDFYTSDINFSDLIIKEDKERISEEVKFYTENKVDSFKQYYGIKNKAGETIYIEDSTIVQRDKNGNPEFFVGVITDNSNLIKTQQQLKENEAFLNNIVNEVNVGIKITHLNKSGVFQNLIRDSFHLNAVNESIISSSISDLIYQLNNNLEEEEEESPFSFNLSQDENYYNISLNYFKNNQGEVTGIIETIKDISHIMEMRNKINEIELFDKLTGLPNKKKLETNVLTMIDSNQSFNLISLDINRFKEINESFGINEGDNILRKISEELRNIFSENEDLSIYRFGGDEFFFISKNTKKNKIVTFLESINKIFRKRFVCQETEVLISSSIGIANFPLDADNFFDLMKNAETAMFKAKTFNEGNHNKIEFYSKEMTNEILYNLSLDNSMRAAINDHNFELHYQPQIDIDSKEIIGVEALVRWNDPVKGLVSPGEFIPAAEKNGLIIELGYEILDMAIKQTANWHNKGFKIGIVAINLSLKQLKQEDFLYKLKTLLRKYNCPAELISLEITESYIMENPEEAIRSLQKIKDLGISLAIDDFGTGYSSLSYLKKLPIDKLKIDKSFIDHIVKDPEDQMIVKTIINLGKNFGLSLIAEGVETLDQENFLKKIHCKEYQGYYFSKPVLPEMIEKLLK